MTSPELVLALLADARLPTGSHAYSAGLEPAIAAGLTDDGRRLEDVPSYASTRLATVTATEAGAAVVARHRWLSGGPHRGDRLDEVARAWRARTPSPAARQTARALGRGYLRLATALWPDELRDCFDAATPPPRPVVLGAVGALTGLSARQVALLVGLDDVQTIASAALKLVPADPTEAARWALRLQPEIEAMADAVAPLTEPAQIPARGAPMIDVFAEAHDRSTRRLFSA